MAWFKWVDVKSTILDIIVQYPKRFKPLGVVTEDLLRGPSKLPTADRELLATYVSALNQCQFCYNTHAGVAEQYGVSKQIITALIDDIDKADIADAKKPLFKFAKKLTETPSRVAQTDAEAVFAAGWDDEVLADVIWICAMFNFYNRILDGYGVKGHQHVYTNGPVQLIKHGYLVPPWFIRKRVMKFMRGANSEK